MQRRSFLNALALSPVLLIPKSLLATPKESRRTATADTHLWGAVTNDGPFDIKAGEVVWDGDDQVLGVAYKDIPKGKRGMVQIWGPAPLIKTRRIEL